MDIGEGLGPEVLLTAGDSRLFRFVLAETRRIGIGVNAAADRVEATVLDATGEPVGVGVVQLLELGAGTWFLALRQAADAPPVRARPVLAGIDPPDPGPPDDVVREYLRLAGMTPDSEVESITLTFPEDGIGSADHDFLGPMLPRQALGNSRNVPAVALAQTVGLDGVWGLWHDLGLHDDSLPASHYGAGIAIGGMPVRMHDLATAYGALATDGRLRPLRYTPDAPLADGREVVSPAAARAVTAWLSDPMARLPSFPRMGHSELPFPAAFKTGTSPDFRDAWAVGYTDRYLVMVWVGHPDWQPMRGLSGYRAGASLVSAVLTELHPDRTDGLSDHGLPAPAGWVSAAACPLSGQGAGPRCPNQVTESVPPTAIPVRDCGVHRQELGHTVVDLPPRYAAWQRRAGLTASASRRANAEEPVHVQIDAPVHGARLLRDPEVPADRRTLRLAARVDPPVPQVVWYVDGAPFAMAGPPYEVRWPVTSGAHRFEARVPYRPERSTQVHLLVD